MEIVREWAGRDRAFHLDVGQVLDLEQAIGEGIGQVFIRVAKGTFRVGDVFHTIRLALIGGGMSIVDAKRLMNHHFDARPYMENAAVAGEILAALMVGIEPSSDHEPGEVPERHKVDEVLSICRAIHISPRDLRAMRYSDFVNLLKGIKEAAKTVPDHLTDEEFEDILDRYEPLEQEGSD